MTSATLIAPPEQRALSLQPGLRPTYRCAGCGHVLRVSGLGRHRVYFELDDVPFQDPVMNRVCPGCGRGLPGKSGV
jgi:rubredoxin